MVALLFKNRRIVCNNGGVWMKNGPIYKIGKWQHIRYVINSMTQRYDVFLNDMQTPIVKGYKFRHGNAKIPNCVWIESDETHESTTLLGGVKINGEKTVFPSKELGQAPFFISGVNKVSKKLVIDGKGNDSDWKNATALKLMRGDGQPTCEKSTVKLLWDNQNLYILFEGQAVKPELRKKGPSGKDARVWEKDCFEFFIDPAKSQKNYYHFAGNASNGSYDAKCVLPVLDKKFNCVWQVKTTINKDKWSAEVVIPFKSLKKIPKSGDIWGFNAGRENSYMKEISSWIQLGSFHVPKKFGTIIFIDEKYIMNQPSDAGKKIAASIYSVDSILSDISKKLKVMKKDIDKDPTFKKEYEQHEKEFNSIKAKVNIAETFLAYFQQVKAAKQLLKNVSLFGTLQAQAINYKSLFAPGAIGNKNSYIVIPEISTHKIFPESYIGTPKNVVSLRLAGNEYGSFQLAVVCAKDYNSNEINISVSDLKSQNGKTISSLQIKSFKVDYVKTAFTSQSPRDIPDVLWEGRNFKYKKAKTVETLWFDVYVPEHTEAGIYHGTVTLKPNNRKATTLNLTVKVYGFSLPKAASLKNIFCFVPKWAEMYYGKKMPEEKRLAYFDFIMAHRLEPVNLWSGDKMFMNEDELKYSIKRGKDLILLPISGKEKGFKAKVAGYFDILRRNKWMDKAVFFGHDEAISSSKRLPQMKKMFKLAKKIAPEIPRLNTTHIDPRLYGYVDIWCPLFTYYNKRDTEKRISEGEKVWWYLTDYPAKPYANFNIDSPGIDARIIPWMNWKLNMSGLLYWAMNREWKTNGGQQEYISDRNVNLRDMKWLTPEVKQKIKNGLRWPEIPWIPLFININSKKVSKTNGGGNLMYPGPNWQPLASIRLKNLRNGLQDYEYFVILNNNLIKLKKHNKDIQLIKKVETALSLDGNVIQSKTSYTKDGKQLLMAKKYIANLIIKTNKILGKK